MSLDVLHVGAGANGRHLVKFSAVIEEVGVVGDALFVGLKVHHVHLIESDERHVEANVGLAELSADEEALRGQEGLDGVEGGVQALHGGVVGLDVVEGRVCRRCIFIIIGRERRRQGGESG